MALLPRARLGTTQARSSPFETRLSDFDSALPCLAKVVRLLAQQRTKRTLGRSGYARFGRRARQWYLEHDGRRGQPRPGARGSGSPCGSDYARGGQPVTRGYPV
jgi:hypothetical protein